MAKCEQAGSRPTSTIDQLSRMGLVRSGNHQDVTTVDFKTQSGTVTIPVQPVIESRYENGVEVEKRTILRPTRHELRRIPQAGR